MTEVDDAMLPSHDEMPAFLHQFDVPDAAHISSTHPHVGPPLSAASSDDTQLAEPELTPEEIALMQRVVVSDAEPDPAAPEPVKYVHRKAKAAEQEVRHSPVPCC